ncbi:hypothetical protein [Streptomyces sp. JB150]|uniref:hypothetical protein n=1 Tax=Streptomyces sp. JB150 TaxID=2714844 RepID=UPI00140C47AF|nr:hypothetical protein [Streptomyces sp. JB150]QIJ60755.1 hypothetical protein G7Z13_00910 [Streptomyces sp. JB150]
MSLRPSLLSLRITAAVQSILMLAQVALAGGFLGGHFDMLALHGTLGRVITVVAVLMAVAAFFVRRSGGPTSILPASIVIVVALVGQIALGLARSVALHVVLGVVLACALAVLAQRVLTTPLPARTPAVPARDEAVQPEPVK